MGNTPFARLMTTVLAGDQQNWSEATYVSWANSWLAEVPDDQDAIYFRALHETRINNDTAALADYHRATQLYSLRPHWVEEATLLYKLGRNAEADKLLAHAAAITRPSIQAELFAEWQYKALAGAGEFQKAEDLAGERKPSAHLMTQLSSGFAIYAVSHNGALMANCRWAGGYIELWDVASGREVAGLDPKDSPGDTRSCQDLMFSSDDRMLFATMNDRQTIAFSTSTHKMLGRWSFAVDRVDVVPASYALAGQAGDNIYFHDFAARHGNKGSSMPCARKDPSYPPDFAFSADGNLLVADCKDGLQLVDRRSGDKVRWRRTLEPIHDPVPHQNAEPNPPESPQAVVVSIQWLSPSSIAVIQKFGVDILQADTGASIQTLPVPVRQFFPDGPNHVLAFVPVNDKDARLHRWSLGPSGLSNDTVVDTTISDGPIFPRLPTWPDGIYVGKTIEGQLGGFEFVNATSGKPVSTLQNAARNNTNADFLPDGKSLLFRTTSSTGNGIPTIPRELVTERATLFSLAGAPRGPELGPFTDICGSFAINPVALGDSTLIDIHTRQVSPPIHSLTIKSCSADGSIVAGRTDQGDDKGGKIVVKDLRRDRILFQHYEPLPPHPNDEMWRSALVLSLDGKYVAEGTGSLAGMNLLLRLKVWHTDTGAPVPLSSILPAGMAWDGAYITSAVFSADDHWLAAIDREDLVLADLQKRSIRRIRTSSFGDSFNTRVELLSFTPDLHSLIYGGDDGWIHTVDLASGGELDKWQAADHAISSISYSRDGKLICTVDGSGLVRLWNAQDHTLLVTIVEFIDGTWAVTDPLGRYDAANPNTSIGLHWVVGNRVIELQQLKNRFYTPNLLERTLSGERLPDVAGMDAVSLPPVLSAEGGYNQPTRTIKISITNDGGGVGKLLVAVNGRLLRTIDKPGVAAEGKSFTLPIDLSDAPSVEGDNTIRLTAYDASDSIESREVVVHYTRAPTARGFSAEPEVESLSTGKFYAIVVGTAVFGDPKMNLSFPDKDADSFALALRLGAERLYGKENVWMRILSTEAKSKTALPTKENIRAAFDEVRKLAHPEDTLVVYFSGHGTMSSTNHDLYYYLTMDARNFDIEKDPTLKAVSTVSSEELFTWLREPVKTMPLKEVVILDTCAAGAASDSLARLATKRDIPPDQRRAIELLKDATGTYILMGSAADSVSYEASKYGEGLLTYALLDGMRGRALDDGSRLDVSRWFDDASQRVPELARSIGGIQKPIIAAPKGSGFPVALITKEDAQKIPLALPQPQLLRIVCEDNNQDDPLNLRDPLREQLRALSDVRSRGDHTDVMYLDATDDDLPDALAPKILYTVTGNDVSVRIRLVENRKTAAEQVIAAHADDPNLAKLLADKIVEMAVATQSAH